MSPRSLDNLKKGASAAAAARSARSDATKKHRAGELALMQRLLSELAQPEWYPER